MITELQRVQLLRIAGISEGISFFVLLLIAMPLKYFFQMPGMVTVVGWIHGALFLGYLAAVLVAARPLHYHFLKILVACVAALLPVGTFLLDREWRQRERELREMKTVAR